jgi:hypothetical protein
LGEAALENDPVESVAGFRSHQWAASAIRNRSLTVAAL